MFRRNVFIFQSLSFVLSLDEKFVQPLGEIYFPRLNAGAADSGLPLQFLLKTVLNSIYRCFHFFEQPWNKAIRLLEQSRQQVLPVHFHMAEADRLRLRRLYRFLRGSSKFVQIHITDPPFTICLLQTLFSNSRISFSRDSILAMSSRMTPMPA